MPTKTLYLLSVCAWLLLAGCAESLDHFHRGNKIVERHHIPGTWSIPGDTTKTECRAEQMVWSTHWGKKVCPDTVDPNATLAVDRGSVSTKPYKDIVLSEAIHGLFFVAGLGTLGALMPATTVTQSVTGGTVYASTLNGTAIPGLQFYPR